MHNTHSKRIIYDIAKFFNSDRFVDGPWEPAQMISIYNERHGISKRSHWDANIHTRKRTYDGRTKNKIHKY